MMVIYYWCCDYGCYVSQILEKEESERDWKFYGLSHSEFYNCALKFQMKDLERITGNFGLNSGWEVEALGLSTEDYWTINWIVVYDFMPNGTLNKIIFRKADARLPWLSWGEKAWTHFWCGSDFPQWVWKSGALQGHQGQQYNVGLGIQS